MPNNQNICNVLSTLVRCANLGLVPEKLSSKVQEWGSFFPGRVTQGGARERNDEFWILQQAPDVVIEPGVGQGKFWYSNFSVLSVTGRWQVYLNGNLVVRGVMIEKLLADWDFNDFKCNWSLSFVRTWTTIKILRYSA